MQNNEHDNGEKKPRRKRALLTVGIIVLVLAALVAAYAIWERPPEIGPTPSAAETPKPAPTQAPAAQPGGDPARPEETPEVPEDPTAELDAEPLATDRDSGKYTLLLVGRDVASNSTDTLIVVRLDARAHRIDCVSIPRDTLINISWSGWKLQINSIEILFCVKCFIWNFAIGAHFDLLL